MKTLTILCLILSINYTKAQDDFYNEKLSDSLRALSTTELLEMAKSGYDFNEPISIYEEYDIDGEPTGEDYIHTAFQEVTHPYGYWCDDNSKELIYGLVTHSEKKLLHPFYFFNDPCGERVTDILIYYSLLKEKGYFNSEKEFEEIIDIYYYGYNGDRGDLKNDHGKTVLMYAIEFGYQKSIDLLLKEKLDLSLEDNSGMNVLMYACQQDNIELINKLINKKVPSQSKTTKVNALDYCQSKTAKKLVKKYTKNN